MKSLILLQGFALGGGPFPSTSGDGFVLGGLIILGGLIVALGLKAVWPKDKW
jgi:hypothetical protein